MSKRLTTEEFIERVKEIHGDDSFDFSQTIYKNQTTPVLLSCKKHGILSMYPTSLYNRSGCKFCAIEKRSMSNEEFIEKAKKVHGEDTFDFSITKFKNYSEHVEIICKKHGIISVHPTSLLQGHGCRQCYLENIRTSKEDFLKLAHEKYKGEYEYDLSNFQNLSSIITIICKKHGEYKTYAFSHLNHECRHCHFEKRTQTTKKFIEKSNIIYGTDIFDYSLVEYISSSKKVKIICKKCNKIFERTPNHHLQKHFCPNCNISKKLSTEEFILKSMNTHGDYYDYSKSIYINARTPIIVTCKLHGDFTTRPNNHIFGIGCPVCCSSKGELKIRRYLENNNFIFKQEEKFNNCRNPKTKRVLPFDFYIPNHNILIEYDGAWHFEQKAYSKKTKDTLTDSQYRDSIKNRYCEDNNIRLLRIPYWDFNNIETILDNYFKELNISIPLS